MPKKKKKSKKSKTYKKSSKRRVKKSKKNSWYHGPSLLSLLERASINIKKPDWIN